MFIDRPSQTDLDTERVPMQTTALVPGWHMRQLVGCLERKFLIDFQGRSSWYPEVLVGLKAKTPDRMSQAVGNGSLGVHLVIRTIHGLQEKVLEI